MSEPTPERPKSDDREAWKAYWTEHGMPWRTEPEVDEERQRFLAEHLAAQADIEKGFYPFRDETGGIKLTRADLEWLLATHEAGDFRGPVDVTDERQRERPGVDLRGAVLAGQDLRGLPLSHTVGGNLTPIWYFDGDYYMRLPNPGKTLDALLGRLDEAAICLADANLADASLQGAVLPGVHLERANLSGAQMQGIHLVAAHMEETQLYGAHLEGAWLADAHLEGARFFGMNKDQDAQQAAHLEAAWLVRAQMQDAQLTYAHLEGAYLNDANMDRAWMQHTHCEGVWAMPMRARNAAFNEAHLEGAMLARSDFSGATFIEAHLIRTTLSEAHLEGARFDEAHLAGAWLTDAHLEGTNFQRARCEGKEVSLADVERIRKWQHHFQRTAVPPADFSGAYFDGSTNLKDVCLGAPGRGCVRLADVRWRDTNLAVVSWAKLAAIGEEQEARRRYTEEGVLKDAATRLSEYETAVRANRQLATALRTQGLNEQADHYAYRAHVLQRQVLRRQGAPKWPAYVGTLFLDLIAGYGFRPGRSFLVYLAIVVWFANFFVWLAPAGTFSPVGAFVFSLTSFHGRGFFPGAEPGHALSLDAPFVVLAAFEAFVGLMIEVSFIATFTQRFFAR